ncbi:cytochrome P450 [Schizophyllum amplum]|uniref:Cytochrome P450 n=1 Tax=Schizophyllum amplum TaxID=97359 RepID=A0A550CHM5_9AGAR|nr:cytochrome P450 [Auriculariopsis ampla]
MSSNFTMPSTDAWAGYFAQAGTTLSDNPSYLLLALGSFPIVAVVLNVLNQFLPKDRTRPPVVFHWFPFIGSAIHYGMDPLGFFLSCREKYGNVFTFILLGRKVTVALGAAGNNFILGGKSNVFNAEDAYTHFTTPVFGKDVVYDCPNDKFMEQKKFIKYSLTGDRFREYVGMITEEVEGFIKKDETFAAYQANSKEWAKFDAVETLSQITILTAARTLQGKEVRDNLDKTFAHLYSDLDGGFKPINFLFPNLPLESYRARDRAHKKIADFYIDIIQKRKSGTTENVDDVMGYLMQQKYRNGQQIPDHEVAHMLIALLMAGQHTSSATGAWATLHIAENPELVEVMYAEQVKHFGNPDGSFREMTFEEMRDLPVLDAVIRETLRMHPPIHSIMRGVREDVPVPTSLASPDKEGGVYIIPKGNYTLASPIMSQMDPSIWVHPERFETARWTDPEGFAKQALRTYDDKDGEKIDFGFGLVSKGTESPYQPFGAGRHRCIGEQFAYLQLGVVLTTLVRHLEMKLGAPFPGNDYTTMITMPLAPRDVYYRRRPTAV